MKTLLLLGALALASLWIGLHIGSVPLSMTEIWSVLWQPDQSPTAIIIHQLRLPRVIAAFSIGGCLAIAGLLMQVLLHNPLADPYVLGLSGSAALAVLISLLLGLPWFWQMPMALGGALLSVLILFYLAQKSGWQPYRLLLTGVVLAAGWSALISLILSLSPAQQLPSLLFWLMGDLSQVNQSHWSLLALLIGLMLSLKLAPALDISLLGALKATSLGIDMLVLRQQIFLLSSALTAFSVSLAGSIGFIGLIAPHLARLILPQRHRLLIPATALIGGSLLVLADMVARSLIAPMQLPVGVLTALLGIPILLFLLYR